VKTSKLNITLTPALRQLVEAKVRSGRYQNSSEVVRDALRVLEQGEDRVEDPALEALIQEGLDSGPAQPLTRRAWSQIWAESDRVARTLRGKRKRAA
jgi:antitoxin ParD1/3/4